MEKVLCRDTAKGKIFGICAGLANHLGWELWLVRIVMFSGLVLQANIFLIGYIVAYFILDPCPSTNNNIVGGEVSKTDQDSGATHVPTLKEQVWQAGESSTIVLNELEKSFDMLETRIQSVEKVVTSKEFSLHTEFNKL